MSSESQCVSCSSVENELSSAGVLFQTFRHSILCQRVCQRCSRSNAEGNGHVQIFLVSSLLSAIVEVKSLLVAYGVPYGFLDLDRDSHSFEKNANTREVEDAHQNFVLDCVNFASLGDIRLRSGTVWRKRLLDEDL